jgi:ubiquinone/menaquinone biosynthesis C-methylase UbiE
MMSLDYKKIDKKFYNYTHELDINNNSYIYGEVNTNCVLKIINQFSILKNGDTFIDIGSGCGKLVIGLSKEPIFEDNIFYGIEIHKKRYNFSLFLQEEYNCYHNTEFILGDFKNLFFRNFNVIYCCNTIFEEKENNILFKKINNEFKGYFILYIFNDILKKYLIKKINVQTSWLKNNSIYLFYKDEIII